MPKDRKCLQGRQRPKSRMTGKNFVAAPPILWLQCSYIKEDDMTTDSTVRARIDGRVKDEAAAALKGMGLSVSDAIRLMLVRVAADKALPFAVGVPNRKTVAAMKEAQKG